jgi:8-oxo-dGTP diphosphatase
MVSSTAVYTVPILYMSTTTDHTNAMTKQRPAVGVGVIIRKDDRVLLGKRIGAHGTGTWSFPGGHLEYGEEVFACAERETYEETGIHIKELTYGPYTNTVFANEHRHSLTLYVLADYAFGEVSVHEPDKFERWDWFHWSKLPKPPFLPTEHLLEHGFTPFPTQAR